MTVLIVGGGIILLSLIVMGVCLWRAPLDGRDGIFSEESLAEHRMRRRLERQRARESFRVRGGGFDGR